MILKRGPVQTVVGFQDVGGDRGKPSAIVAEVATDLPRDGNHRLRGGHPSGPAGDIDPGERELIRRLGMRFFTMREIDERGLNICMDEAIAIAKQGSAGYCVTFDVDALDPRDAPGSGTLVRGGLSYRESHLAMEKIAEAGGMRSLEVVEINTALDVNNRTAELGVELILSALGKTIL